MPTTSQDHFEAVIIGAGMSGLAAGIRLAHFGKKVLILERHNASGGLNSFYSFDGYKFDVGLHALTNYARAGAKGTPLTKVFRQLRIPREAFDLSEQKGSKVAFPGIELRFTNDFVVLESEIRRVFPKQIDHFQRLVQCVRGSNELTLEEDEGPMGREVVGQYLTDPLLIEMILCPLLCYGSAQENDIPWGQFVIMFKSIYLEGFARPYEGVRRIIRALVEQYRKLGGRRRMKCGVRKILTKQGKVQALLLDDESIITADHILSSIGRVETMQLCDDPPSEFSQIAIGRISLVETITLLKEPPSQLGWEDTIIFFNDDERFHYARPKALVDPRSGVISCPNNYQYPEGQELKEGILRVSSLANFEAWSSLPEKEYRQAKAFWQNRLAEQALRFLNPLKSRNLSDLTIYRDMFTPRTVKKFTGHLGGAIYGTPHKMKNGRTPLKNLYLCGNDQGYIGIVGAMLSGISMVNYHILQKS